METTSGVKRAREHGDATPMPLDKHEADDILSFYVPLRWADYTPGYISWGAPRYMRDCAYEDVLFDNPLWCMAQREAQKTRPYACRAPFVEWLEKTCLEPDNLTLTIKDAPSWDRTYKYPKHVFTNASTWLPRLAVISALSRSFDDTPLARAVTSRLCTAMPRLVLGREARSLAILAVRHHIAHARGAARRDMDARYFLGNTPPRSGLEKQYAAVFDVLHATADTRAALPYLHVLAKSKGNIVDLGVTDASAAEALLPPPTLASILAFFDSLDLRAPLACNKYKLAGVAVGKHVNWVLGTHAVAVQRYWSKHSIDHKLRELLLFAAAIKKRAGIKLETVTLLSVHAGTRTTLDLSAWHGEEAVAAWAERKVVNYSVIFN